MALKMRDMKKVIGLRVQKAVREDAYSISEISSEASKEGMVKEFKPEQLMEILSSEKYRCCPLIG